VHKNADGNARLKFLDECTGKGGVVHEPESGVYSYSLVLNQFQKLGSAVLERHIAQAFGPEDRDNAKQ
ncbi:MAG TPA: hypothetical protein VFA40_00900, partial [Terriglobales bacterium]|nr:hypothetical protein [Terriglobales bacterium]